MAKFIFGSHVSCLREPPPKTFYRAFQTTHEQLYREFMEVYMDKTLDSLISLDILSFHTYDEQIFPLSFFIWLNRVTHCQSGLHYSGALCQHRRNRWPNPLLFCEKVRKHPGLRGIEIRIVKGRPKLCWPCWCFYKSMPGATITVEHLGTAPTLQHFQVITGCVTSA